MTVLADLGLTADDLREAVQAGALVPSRRPQAAAPEDAALEQARRRLVLARHVLARAKERGEAWAEVQGPALVRLAGRELDRQLIRRRVSTRQPASPERRRHSTGELRAALGLPIT